MGTTIIVRNSSGTPSRNSKRARVRGPSKSATTRLISAIAKSEAGTEASNANSARMGALTCNSRACAKGNAKISAVITAMVPR